MEPIIGLMSGTSIDGIDASFVFTDGKTLNRTNYNSFTPYKKNTVRLIKKILENPEKEIKNFELTNHLSLQISLEHALASQKLINKSKIKPEIIGFHGQTVFHNPSKHISIQLGDPYLLSKMLKTKVVYQFRKADLINNGQGAPIAPIYHKEIINKLNIEHPAVIVNIGGISNLTYIDKRKLIGFDTGPGNNYMDFFMQNNFNKSFDNKGLYSKLGTPNHDLIKKFCDDVFFKETPPKSLERSKLFENQIYKQILLLDPLDSMATLCLLTAETIKKGFQLLPKKVKTTIIVGGGQNNCFLINQLEKTLNSKVYSAKSLNLPGNFIEAELIAFLAARRIYNLPSTFPTTTGVKSKTVIGEIIDFKS